MRQRRQTRGIRLHWLRIFLLPILERGFVLFGKLGELLGFPAGAALGEDARQQLRASFRWGVFGAPVCRERAFDSGFQERLAVLLELFLRGFEFGYAGIEVG